MKTLLVHLERPVEERLGALLAACEDAFPAPPHGPPAGLAFVGGCGEEFAAQVARLRLAGIPAIVGVTSDSTAAEARRILEAGCDDWLDPAEPDAALAPRLEELVRRRAAAPARLAELDDLRIVRLVGNLAVGVVIHDAQGRVVFCNPAAFALLGVAEADLLGSRPDVRVWDVVDEEGAPFPGETLPAPLALATGQAVSGVAFGVLHPGKSARTWVLADAEPELDAAGNVARVFCTLTDITARKRAEEDLRAEEERQRELFENASDIVYTHDLQGNFTAMNNAGHALFGYSAGELVGTNIAGILEPDELARAREMTARKVQGGASKFTRYELKVRARDGRQVPLEVNTRLIFQEGRPVAVQGIARDVTDRRRMEDQLRYQAQVLDQVDAAVVATDPDGRIVFWNAYAEELFGWTRAEALGRDVIGLLEPADPALAARYMELLTRRGTADVSDRMLKRKDGGTFEAHVSLTPLHDPATGATIGIAGVSFDLTSRKRAELLLARQARILEEVTRGTPLVQVLDDLCRMLEDAAPGALASVLLLDEAGTHLFRGAAPSLPAGYSEAIDGVAVGPGAGSCGTAIFRGEPVEVADIEHDPLWAEYCDLALSYGLRACSSMPLAASSGRLVGALAFYYREPRGPAPAERQVFAAGRHIAAIAIERHAAEAALRESEARARDLFENAHDLMYTVDVTGHITSVNASMERVLGYSRDELIGRSVISLLEGGSRDAVLGRTQQRLAGNLTVDRGVLGVLTRGGSVLQIEITSRPIVERGKVVGLHGIGRDITAQLAAQAEFARLAAIVESSDESIISRDLEGRVLSWNRGAERMFGYSAAEVMGRTLEFLETEGQAGDVARVVARERAGKIIEAIELRRRTKDGRIIDVSSSFFPVHGPGGEIIAVAGIGHDITEQKLAEREMARLAAVVESTEDVVVLRDAEGYILSWNAGAERLYGYTAEEVIGTRAEFLLPPEERGGPIPHIAEAAAGWRFENLEVKRLTRDGREVWLHSSVFPVRDSEGNLIAVGAVGRDITGRKRNEEAIQRLAALVDASDDAIVSRAVDGTLLSWNKGAERLLGYDERTAAASDSLFHVPEELRDEWAGIVGRVTGGETVSGYETQRLAADGRRVDVSVSIFPVRDSAGQITSVAGIWRDMTARKQQEDELRRTIAVLQALHQLRDALNRAATTGEILEAAVESVCTTLGTGRVWALMPEREGGHYGVARGVSEQYQAGAAARGHVAGVGVFRDGPVLVRDVRTRAGLDEELRQRLLEEGILSTALFPLTVRGRNVGRLDVFFDEPRSFTPGEIQIGQTIAASVAFALDQHRSEEALRASEETFRALARTMPSPMWVSTAAGYLFVNDALVELSGYSETELLSMRFVEDLVHPEYRDEMFRRRDGRLAGNAAPGRIEVPITTRSGEIRWLDTSAQPVSYNGRPALVGAAVDITERRRAEEALRTSEANYRAVVEGTSDAIFALDRDEAGSFRITFVNTAFANLTGLRPDRIRGKTAIEALGDYGPDAESKYARAVAAGEAIEYEEAFSVGTRRVEIVTNLTPLFDQNGYCYRIVGSSRDLGERRRAEAEIHRLGRILDDSQLEVYVIDASDPPRFRQLNQRALANLGYRAEEIQAMDPLDVVAGGDREGWAAAVHPLWRGERQELVMEREFIRKDGTTYPVEISLQLSRTEDPPAYFAIAKDLTEQKRAEEALRQAEEYLHVIVDNAPVVLFALDAEGRFTLSEGAGMRLLGLEAGQVVGMSAYELYADYPPIIANMERCLGGETVIEEVDFGGLTFDSHYTPLFNAGGTVTGMIGIATDVTERKRADRARRLAELRLSTVAANAPIILWAVDAEGTYTLMEGHGLQMLGSTSAAVVGRSAFEVRRDSPRAMANIRRGLAGEEFTDVTEYRDVTFENNYTPLRDEAGNVTGLIGVSLDVTERWRAEQVLLQAQKLESLGILAGGIAHDFNNLLVGILGNAGLALADLPPESPARETVEQIEIAGLRAADLARQMLAYSGKGRFVVQRLDLNSVVEEMTHLLRVSISKRAELQHHLAERLPAVEADATQLRQVVMNLVVNASDAIGDHDGAISISTGCVAVSRAFLADAYLAPDLPEGDYVYLEIRDTGAGMDAATRARIFDPFFTTKFTGRGLGLAAVLGIVRGHKGAIKVESEPGQGTTFTLLLPALPAGEGEARLAKAPPTSWEGAGTILVVDDEETVRNVTARALESFGFSVIRAGDGEEGLELFQAHRGEIVCTLLDMTMPRMNGEDAFRAIRTLDPSACVILMSGYNEQEAIDRFADEGLSGFIQKPYELAGLKDTIRTALSATR